VDKKGTSLRVSAVVGIDVQSISEVEASIDEFGNRYLQRLFTSREMETRLGASFSEASSYAGRFAAKEAVLKLLNPREIIPMWREIEIFELTGGRAEIGLYGIAAELAHKKGIVSVSVSISCARGFAMAAAVANS
jgi:holo-[acyl-carrier protein] synthase